MTPFQTNMIHSARDGRDQHSWKPREVVSAVVLLIFSMVAVSTALGFDEQSLTAPVRKIVVAEPDPSMQMVPMLPEEPPAATPAARMPQYQLHLRDLSAPVDASTSRLRFVLATPEGPMLIEAEIQIDGQPYQMAREQRVQEIMRFLEDPETYKAEIAKRQAEIDAAAAAAATLEAAKKGLLETIKNLVTGENESESDNKPESTPSPESSDSPVVPSEVPEKTEEAPLESEKTEAAPTEDAASEKEEPAEKTEGTEPAPVEAVKEPEVPAGPRYVAPATLIERIERYSTAIGGKPTVEEVRWLMSEWIDGPVLLFLNDNFQRFRADQQPAFRVLDRDQDGRISAEELEHCVVSFQECDADRNDVVEATELTERADGMGEQVKTSSHGKLIYRLPQESDATAFLKRLTEHYASHPTAASATNGNATAAFDKDGNGAISPEELQTLKVRPADIQLRLDLNTGTPDTSMISIAGFSEEFSTLAARSTRNASSLMLAFDSFYLEFLGAQQGSANGPNGIGADQISLGAVNDGYAMLPEADPNSDGRFTIRELRQLKERLKSFDSNSDGQIEFHEIHPTIRVCLGLGPTAHEPLAMLRDASRVGSTISTPGPEWFAEMDKNKDYDLTRQEFPGTDEQFQQLDKDQDELISSEEANLSGG